MDIPQLGLCLISLSHIYILKDTTEEKNNT